MTKKGLSSSSVVKKTTSILWVSGRHFDKTASRDTTRNTIFTCPSVFVCCKNWLTWRSNGVRLIGDNPMSCSNLHVSHQNTRDRVSSMCTFSQSVGSIWDFLEQLGKLRSWSYVVVWPAVFALQRIDDQSLLFSTGHLHRVLLSIACSSYSMIRAQQLTHLSLKQRVSREKRNKHYLQTPTTLFKALSSVKRLCRNVQRRAAVSNGHSVTSVTDQTVSKSS